MCSSTHCTTSDHVACGGTCVPGNCCTNNECSNGFACQNNVCSSSQCADPAGIVCHAKCVPPGQCASCGGSGQPCCPGNTCTAGKCSNGVCCPGNQINCNGRCQQCCVVSDCISMPGQTPSCNNGTCQYSPTCGAADGVCPTGCTNDVDCKKALGAACMNNAECESNTCADRHCCTRAACGACLSCTGSAGTCVANDAVGGCATGQVCVNGACKKQNGVSCTDASECQTGLCTDGHCCTRAVCDPCQSCGAGGTCITNDGAGRCSPGQTCANGVCKKANGGPCASDAECVTNRCNVNCCATTGCPQCQTCTGPNGACAPNGTKACMAACIPEKQCCACDTSLKCSATGREIVASSCNTTNGVCGPPQIVAPCNPGPCMICSGGRCVPDATAQGKTCETGSFCAANGACVLKTCGGVGMPCCANSQCDSPLGCIIHFPDIPDFQCALCGAINKPCCTTGDGCSFDPNLTCVAFSAGTHDCVHCGQENEPCCGFGNGSPGTCTAGLLCHAEVSVPVCRHCGDQGDICCPGSSCNGSLLCVFDTSVADLRCLVCGASGGPCCPTDPACQDGTACIPGGPGGPSHCQ
jgi:hypothetical protein